MWSQASAFAITLAARLVTGAKIAIEGPVDFHEIAADSIRLDDTNVENGEAGQTVGIACGEGIAVVHENQRVFVVTPPETPEAEAG